jgi:cysteinyl-tRNA synthetase
VLIVDSDILALCDRLRDEDLVDLGVCITDREGGLSAQIELRDKEVMIKERNAKREVIFFGSFFFSMAKNDG